MRYQRNLVIFVLVRGDVGIVFLGVKILVHGLSFSFRTVDQE